MTHAEGLPEGLARLIPPYLAHQRWYAGRGEPAGVALSGRLLWSAPDGMPRLWWVLVEDSGERYQLLLGERPGGQPADFLHGQDTAVLGACGASYFYDATVDAELAIALLETISGGAHKARRVRPISAEQSHTSLVYDDRLILKVYRRLLSGQNPDVEMTTALAQAGFAHVAEPLVHWAEGGIDLAFGQRYLAGGVEGWKLAVTSVRDLYGASTDATGQLQIVPGLAQLDEPPPAPAQAGGDFGAEARRIGRLTAEMHLALAEIYGAQAVTTPEWAELVSSIESRVAAAGLGGPAQPLLRRLRAVHSAGPAIRVHGDFHLGQVMRTDAGWFVLDFEGEPARSLEQRRSLASPLKDVTGMLRSFDYAARFVLAERSTEEAERLEDAAVAWVSHNRQAFLEGYLAQDGSRRLLPPPGEVPAVLMAYEVDKVLYELEYEQAYRPEWAFLPIAALGFLLGAGSPGGWAGGAGPRIGGGRAGGAGPRIGGCGAC
jgi:maltokinase